MGTAAPTNVFAPTAPNPIPQAVANAKGSVSTAATATTRIAASTQTTAYVTSRPTRFPSKCVAARST